MKHSFPFYLKDDCPITLLTISQLLRNNRHIQVAVQKQLNIFYYVQNSVQRKQTLFQRSQIQRWHVHSYLYPVNLSNFQLYRNRIQNSSFYLRNRNQKSVLEAFTRLLKFSRQESRWSQVPTYNFTPNFIVYIKTPTILSCPQNASS